MKKRKLQLNRETLGQIDASRLAPMAGGWFEVLPFTRWNTCFCLTESVTCPPRPSFDIPCIPTYDLDCL